MNKCVDPRQDPASAWSSTGYILAATRLTGCWLGRPSEKYESLGISLPNIWKNEKLMAKPNSRSYFSGCDSPFFCRRFF